MESQIPSKSSIYDHHHHHHQLRKIKIQTPSTAEIHPIFPEEIITEILSRLPVKSLLKFRCVSKSWRSLISTKHFIKSHLTISTKNTKFNHHSIISTLLHPYYTLKSCSLHSLLYNPITYAVDFDYPMKNPKNSVRIVGCCNGLVCIAINGKYFFLWNPSTKQHKKLPDVDGKMKNDLFITKYGFGYDECNDDYKVVGIVSGFFSVGRFETMVKVYSLRTNSWKKIEVFKDGLPFDINGKFVSGKLHWGRRNGSNSKWDVVYFDLDSEICGTVEQPSYVEGGFSPSLGVLGECLCVLCDFPETSVDVWVLKRYGVKESWDKVVTVPYSLRDPWKGPYSTPLFIGPKGEVFLVYGSSFVMYDPKDNWFKRPDMVDFGAFLEADVYVESLVSLVPNGELKAQNQKQKHEALSTLTSHTKQLYY
ncbi:hypothetical protein BUALT_Bualt01G0108200 [Buddleja alternifolia]|uniref:F-box domain-containing protein n=1 Tax=Buddleja alternifolia TaxID=168488 RepID=A0AAV6Y721_9LAMI|nr:hypothetical protein BUALT_Bualt01G0108200 [Buddleja alternifolia]